MAELRLLKPSAAELPGYVDALERGWSPDVVSPAETAKEELRKIAADQEGFLSSLDDPEAKGEPIKLPDGSTVPRLPGFRRWMWDREFCGSIGFRWQRGTSALPPHVLGHIGYTVVPWKRSRGYATKALALLLPEARKLGLAYVELTADADNIASQKVIVACGGRFVERFHEPSAFGGAESLRYRIDLR
jgi:predicted acetyltransferase